MKWIDAHIHPDLYSLDDRKQLLEQLGVNVEAIIAVSLHQDSCRTNLELAHAYSGMYLPAFGYHPEQPIPDMEVEQQLFAWIREHHTEAIAIGEVGLPYYTRTEFEAKGISYNLNPYISLLERFILLSIELNKPIILHAVYEDADIVCGLLEKHCVTTAHFHWFKGPEHTVKRMARNGYYISISPDVCYEEEIRELVRIYPIEQLMVETDGPWPFEAHFKGKTTLPSMVRDVVHEIAVLKGLDPLKAASIINENTRRFYRIE